jgi:hypothetical protein
MRTVHIHRILGLVAVLATVGSFLIEVRGMLSSDKGTPAEISGPSKAPCDWTIYEPVIRKMRANPKPADVERFALLGADSYFTYYYDFETDRVLCAVQSKPGGPLVEASRLDPPDHMRRNVILVCVIVIVVSGTGLKVIQMTRQAQSGK